MTKNAKILSILETLYPDAAPELNFNNPYETLVATILSAQSTDKQVNKATPALFSKYPDVESLAKADVADVFELVKSCGFKKKAAHIIGACQMISSRWDGKVPGTMEELTELPGVGRKTANVVLANAFGGDAIAVDTHVFRVSNRLGIADSANVLHTEQQLMRAIPKEKWSVAHHYLILHGRRVCHARNPQCAKCALAMICSHNIAQNSHSGT